MGKECMNGQSSASLTRPDSALARECAAAETCPPFRIQDPKKFYYHFKHVYLIQFIVPMSLSPRLDATSTCNTETGAT